MPLYSDRTPEQWLQGRPTGTAARFGLSLQLERELGLNYWDNQVPWVEGAHITVCPKPRNRLLTLTGRMRQPFLAIDLRLQSHRWMKGLVERGGRIQIESVTVGRLEEIAAEHELTLVAAGRAEPCRIFERHAARSVHDAPQCQLALMCIKGPKMRFDDLPLVPVKFNALPGMGEAFYVPHHHNDVGRMTRGAAPAPRGVPGRGRRRDGAREGLTRLRAGQAEGRPVEAGSVGWRPLAVFAEARRATRGPGRPPARRRRT